jgi:Leucine-rich repeat (LRR) protein
LAGLQELEGLWLVDTGINDAQLNQLYALKSLLTLDISRCKISQTAKQALQRALPKTKITGP